MLFPLFFLGEFSMKLTIVPKDGKLYNIYGKVVGSSRRMRPMDLKKNIFVVNLIHASMLPKYQAEIVLQDLRDHNKFFDFEMRKIK